MAERPVADTDKSSQRYWWVHLLLLIRAKQITQLSTRMSLHISYPLVVLLLALLLTIGDRAGEVLGLVDGHQVYHSSLNPMEYKEILTSAGFSKVSVVLCDKDCGEHSVLLASGYEYELG